MSTCTVPANQSIYQALIDKAASYPADKPYQAKAYKKAAEIVAAYPDNIYNMWAGTFWFEAKPAAIGYKIEEFINQFIKANPLKPVEQPKPVETYKYDWYQSYLDSMKTPVYTAENPRRSRRISYKPMVEYFTKEEKEEDEREEIADVIYSICAKRGLNYSDELITEFDDWLITVDLRSHDKYDCKTGQFISPTKTNLAKEWAKYYSTSLMLQNYNKKLTKKIINYCIKNNIEYEDEMADKFSTWMDDPANKSLITYMYNGCYLSCYPRSQMYCINKWFSTLKKKVIF